MAKTKSDGERLMTLPQLAVYLHMSEKTVVKLATASKLPGALIDGQWRFKRPVIDAWLEKQVSGDDGEFDRVPDGMRLPLGDLLVESSVIVDLRAKDAIGVIEELAARAYSNGWLADKPWFIGAVVEREALASTAMEGGVAFLHTRARDTGKISRPFMVVGRSYAGIDFGAPDGALTYLFFLLGLKYDKLHLPILGRLARSLRNPATVSKLRATSSPAVMRNVLLREDVALLAGTSPPRPPIAPPAPPKLDLTVRKRAIMRVNAQRKADRAEDEATAREAARPAGRKKKK